MPKSNWKKSSHLQNYLHLSNTWIPQVFAARPRPFGPGLSEAPPTALLKAKANESDSPRPVGSWSSGRIAGCRPGHLPWRRRYASDVRFVLSWVKRRTWHTGQVGRKGQLKFWNEPLPQVNITMCQSIWASYSNQIANRNYLHSI